MLLPALPTLPAEDRRLLLPPAAPDPPSSPTAQPGGSCSSHCSSRALDEVPGSTWGAEPALPEAAEGDEDEAEEADEDDDEEAPAASACFLAILASRFLSFSLALLSCFFLLYSCFFSFCFLQRSLSFSRFLCILAL